MKRLYICSFSKLSRQTVKVTFETYKMCIFLTQFCFTQESVRGHGTTLLFSSRQPLIQSVQETWRLSSVQSSLTLRLKHVQEITVCSGSESDQINLIRTSSTLMETDVMNVKTDLTLRKAAFITSLRRSAPLMLELTTVLWPHVERFCLEMELKWKLVWFWIQ